MTGVQTCALPISLTDALNFLEYAALGDVNASKHSIKEVAEKNGQDPKETAEQTVDYACSFIRDNINTVLREVNSRPVYTVHEMVHPHPIVPKELVLLGGPARIMSTPLSNALEMEVTVSPHYKTANAIGAAVTKTTTTITFFADTEKGYLSVPELNITKPIAGSYSLSQAKTDARKMLIDHLSKNGFPFSERDVEIIEAESFPMMDWTRRLGDNIRVTCGIQPGILFSVSTNGADHD